VPLSYDDDQRAFMSSVTDALAHHCPMSLVREIAEVRPDRWTEIWWPLHDLDLLGLLVPESAGGLELTAVELAAVLEAAGHVAPPVPLAMTIGAYVPLIVAAGGESDEATALLADVVAGGTGTVALAVGHDGETIEAQLDGSKLTLHCDAVPEATRAARVAVPAVRAQDGRVVLVVATPAQLGLEIAPAMDPTSPIGLLDLEDHDIGDAIVLPGDPRPGLPTAWIAAASELVGLGAALVQRAVDYARDRVQFGQPIGTFQAVKHQIVDAHLAVERARSLTLYAAILAAEESEGAAAAAHNAKAAASEAATTAARVAVQVHGGPGITKEEDVSLLYLRARQASQLLGGPDFHYLCAESTTARAAAPAAV
jgi:alkylation response protein AidB-like acyl-CoA dehydrogenase